MVKMTAKQKERMILVLAIVIGVSVAAGLAVSAFRENMMYFLSPTDISQGKAPKEHLIRLGGMVAKNTVKRATDSLEVRFDVTDFVNTIGVSYTGILPDLFREGQGIIAIGKLNPDGSFVASEVLAKHDEKYMPPEVAASLKKAAESQVPGAQAPATQAPAAPASSPPAPAQP